MDVQEELNVIQKELLELIVVHLKENKMDAPTARKLAADFLAVLPIKDQQDLLNKLKNLGDTYPEAKHIYVQELEKVNKEKRDDILIQMRNFIQQGNMDQAITIAKSLG